MNIQEAWSKALKETDIIRARILSLQTFGPTQVPYILLSPSDVNAGDTVVRSGEIMIDRPSLILPPHLPQLEGFEFDHIHANEDSLMNFLLVRGVTLPSLKYNNITNQMDIFEGKVPDAIRHFGNKLEREENTSAGLLVGPGDVWQFSLLIFTCSLIARNSTADVNRILEDLRRRNG